MNKKYGSQIIADIFSEPLIKWENKNEPFHIHLEHPEYASLCPRSGYPDSGAIIVDYIPNKWLVELKSFKLYINGFRDCYICHEDSVNAIADKLFGDIAPLSLRVIGDFMRRGGVKTIITVSRGDYYLFPEYKHNLL
jgi:7-cyano-7-deazaguanine reductase